MTIMNAFDYNEDGQRCRCLVISSISLLRNIFNQRVGCNIYFFGLPTS